MPLSPQQRERVLAAIEAGRLPLERPQKMYAGHGEGRVCDGCGEPIDKTQIEYEAVYTSGHAAHLHLGCAGLLDAEQSRRARTEAVTEDATRAREQSRASREQAQTTAKASQQLRDQADLLAREAEAVIEESRRVRRGDPAGP
jgi:hypothetical protein